MKRLRMLLAAGIVFSVTGAALCQTNRPATMPASMPASMPSPVMGTLVKVDGNNLIVNARQRGGEPKEMTVATDAKTEFIVDGESGKLTDLKPEMEVGIRPSPATAARPARLMVVASSRGLMGTVVKVDGKNVVLRVRQRGGEAKEVTVGTDEKTKVFFLGDDRALGKVGKLADLEAGTRVNVLPETGTAAKIICSGRDRGRPGSMPASRPARVDGL